jgi:hypothetical protein
MFMEALELPGMVSGTWTLERLNPVVFVVTECTTHAVVL